jgi:hypothetical protein
MQALILTHLDPARFLREHGTLWRFLDCFKMVFIASSRTCDTKEVNNRSEEKMWGINSIRIWVVTTIVNILST